jgi:hypothetical protein
LSLCGPNPNSASIIPCLSKPGRVIPNPRNLLIADHVSTFQAGFVMVTCVYI